MRNVAQLASLRKEIAQTWALGGVVLGKDLGGLSSHNVPLDCEQGAFVFKQLSPEAARTAGRLARVTTFVARQRLPVAAWRPTVSQTAIARIEGVPCMLFLRLSGSVRHGPQWSPSMYRQAAQMLARWHALGDAADHTRLRVPGRAGLARPTGTALCAVKTICRSLPQRSPLRQPLQTMVNAKEAILAQTRISAPRGATDRRDLLHGDFHNENLLFHRNKILTGVLDLEQVARGHGVHDLVHFLQIVCGVLSLSPHSAISAQHFFRAYAAKCPITQEDLVWGMDCFMARMAASVFFESRWLRGDARMQTYVARDSGLCVRYAANRHEVLDRALARLGFSTPSSVSRLA